MNGKWLNTLERMLARTRPEGDGCLVWTGCCNSDGYGKVSYRGRLTAAHRAVWMASGRHLAPDDCLLHRCDNPPCVNPDHLFVGTRADNSRDAREKGRTPRGERNGMATLSEQQIHAIRSSTARLGELAAEYGVSKAHICNVRKRHRWGHLVDSH